MDGRCHNRDHFYFLSRSGASREFFYGTASNDAGRRPVQFEHSSLRRLFKIKNTFPRAYIDSNSNIIPINISKYEPNKIELQTNLQTPGNLILSENWYPGWKAYDNNKEIKISKTNYIFRSIYLEKGQHNVKFIYDPFPYKFGKAITILSLILMFYRSPRLLRRFIPPSGIALLAMTIAFPILNPPALNKG